MYFVLVTSSFPIADDGSEAAGSFVVDLANELAKHVNVCVVAPGIHETREQWSKGVQVRRYAAPPRPLSTLKPWRPRDLHWIVRVWFGGLKATREAVANGAIGVLALWALPCGAWARRAASHRNVEYSVWMLGSDVWSLGRIPLMRGLLANVMRSASRRYADGLQLARDSEAICGLPVEFLPTARVLQTRNPPPPATAPPYRFVFVGRWHHNKGVDLLLDALGLLKDKDWQNIAEVAIYGGGPLHSLVREKAQPLLDAGRPLVVGGFIPKAAAERAVMNADWVLIPSRIESIPVIFSDAMKLGRPVIATPVGDLPNLVRSGCGIICDSVDACSIARSLRMASNAKGEFNASAINARATEFSLESACGRLMAEMLGER